MYASLHDINERYGEDALLIVADDDNDGQVNLEKVDRALQDATDEMDTYLAKKYSLPLPSAPGVLVRLCVDIALYRLSGESAYTEEKRKRYEDALKTLKSFSTGEISLGLPAQQEPNQSAGSIDLITTERRFNRSNMNRLT